MWGQGRHRGGLGSAAASSNSNSAYNSTLAELQRGECRPWAAGYGLRTADCGRGLWDAGCGLRAAGCGMRDAGWGLRAAGRGLRAAEAAAFCSSALTPSLLSANSERGIDD